MRSLGWDAGKRILALATAGLTGGTAVTLAVLDDAVKASDLVHPTKAQWPHSGFLDSLDHRSIRRGYQVYKQVCAACHSMQYLSYRQLVGVSHTEEEATAEAAESTMVDGPDDTGKMFERPGVLNDQFPKPFANDQLAAIANNGAIPPDLSFITFARHGGEDYVYHLLNGYTEAPAGFNIEGSLHFNPYFPGGALAMAPPLYDEIIEYEDGTPATQSQLAKDVVTFLVWAGGQEHDQRKRMGLKVVSMLAVACVLAHYWKCHKFSTLKSSVLKFTPKKYKSK